MHQKTDSEIEQWVLRELALAEALGSREICVQSHDGVVTLNGSVPEYADRSLAERAVYRVVGIARVVNDLKVKPHCAKTRKIPAMVTEPESFKPDAVVPLTRPEQR